MLCAVRFVGSKLVAWWFADVMISGRLILERYAEFLPVDPDADRCHDFTRTCEYKPSRDGLVSFSSIPFPKDVLEEIRSQVTTRVPNSSG